MFRARLMRVSTGVLFAGQLFTVGAEKGVDTCDPASGTCSADAGDDMSAMQLRSGWGPQPPAPTPGDGCRGEEGCGDYWELVDAKTLGDVVPYSKEGEPFPNTHESDAVPWCLQGLVYLDQWCTSYPKLSKKEQSGPCLGFAHGHYWVNEMATAFGQWSEEDRCFTAERKSWVFGQADIAYEVCRGPGIRACMRKKGFGGGWSHDVCEEGATYDAVMPGTPPGLTWSFVKTKNAWSRTTPISWFQNAYYPVLTIVNGTGHKTKFYQDMLDEAMRTTCPPGSADKGGSKHKPPCRRSQWASEGKLARCTRNSLAW